MQKKSFAISLNFCNNLCKSQELKVHLCSPFDVNYFRQSVYLVRHVFDRKLFLMYILLTIMVIVVIFLYVTIPNFLPSHCLLFHHRHHHLFITLLCNIIAKDLSTFHNKFWGIHDISQFLRKIWSSICITIYMFR